MDAYYTVSPVYCSMNNPNCNYYINHAMFGLTILIPPSVFANL